MELRPRPPLIPTLSVVPGPPALPVIGHIPAFRRDILGLLSRGVRDYGDLVRFRLGPRSVYLVNHPDGIRQVLKTNAANYDKNTRSTAFIRDVCGESLLTSNGEAWKRRRHAFQPAFHRSAIEGFTAIMREEAEALVGSLTDRHEFDASGALMATTFRVVARALFGTGIPEAMIALIEPPISLLLAETFARNGALFGWKSRAFRRNLRILDQTVATILSAPRPQSATPDLLDLMRAGDFNATELRNEAVTFLLAGHETTANALTWLLAYLAALPDEQERCAHDPEALDRALSETLRLRPPIWILERHAIGEDVLGGHSLPSGSSVIVCPYTVHRHPGFWSNPEVFDPDRFHQHPPPAYLPFGLGPRACIGQEFSLAEARIIASALLRRFRFAPVSAHPPVPEPAITLRVAGGLRLRIEPRAIP